LNKLLQSGVPPLSKGNFDLISSPHVKTNDKPADILRSAQVEWPENLPTPPFCGKLDISTLLVSLSRIEVGAFDYSTEADIQSLVKQAVEDALEIMGLSAEFRVKLECSLFSFRPDLVVVFHKFLGVVLVIEVKKPERSANESVDSSPAAIPQRGAAYQANKKFKETEGLFDGQLVAGQMFDYLKGMVNMGNATPFAVLITFDSMVITWIDSVDSDKLLAEELRKLSQPQLSPPPPQ
jgi:hypothetical protein